MDIPDASHFFGRQKYRPGRSEEENHQNPLSDSGNPPPPRTEETWERDSEPELETNATEQHACDSDGLIPISIDRPVYLSLINLVQLMEPRMFLALNPLMLIGTLTHEVNDISEDAIDSVNDMIESIWGKRIYLIVPIVLEPAKGLLPIKRGVNYPVQGLKVATKVVATAPENRAEEAIVGVKADFKHQDIFECIESGRSIIKLTLLGKLVTTPSKPSLTRYGRHELRDSVDEMVDRSRSRRRRHSSRSRRRRSTQDNKRTGSPGGSVYSFNERAKNSKLNRLMQAFKL
jgi:hypothetical protein